MYNLIEFPLNDGAQDTYIEPPTVTIEDDYPYMPLHPARERATKFAATILAAGFLLKELSKN